MGDVVTAAVVFPDNLPEGLRDSKKISAKKRLVLDGLIRMQGEVSIGRASPQEIDEMGILRATLFAMTRAWEGLSPYVRRNALVIVDGDQAPAINARMELMPRADDLCPTVSAASIVAKVWRDEQVEQLAIIEPQYGWDKNKGYGTKLHVAAIEKYGPSKHHRRSFAPIRQMVRGNI